ncbi:MAG: hypothetical protein ACE5GD_03770 [Candidatus Geothermarchaeales archaeon]
MLKKPKRTTLFIMDEFLWKWAKYKAGLFGYESVSEYVFDLILLDKKDDVLKYRLEKNEGSGPS